MSIQQRGISSQNQKGLPHINQYILSINISNFLSKTPSKGNSYSPCYSVIISLFSDSCTFYHKNLYSFHYF